MSQPSHAGARLKPDPTLTLLIERSRENYEASTRALGMATTQRERQAQKLGTLEEYRSEYRGRMDRHAESGLAMPELLNYRRFVAQLDQAVEQQQQAVRRADQGVAAARLRWQEAHRELKSYEVLLDRRTSAAERVANRREQRESDAYAQRIAQTRKPDLP